LSRRDVGWTRHWSICPATRQVPTPSPPGPPLTQRIPAVSGSSPAKQGAGHTLSIRSSSPEPRLLKFAQERHRKLPGKQPRLTALLFATHYGEYRPPASSTSPETEAHAGRGWRIGFPPTQGLAPRQRRWDCAKRRLRRWIWAKRASSSKPKQHSKSLLATGNHNGSVATTSRRGQ
jgi:hypothetical protein